jgi:hypothetical protein
VGSCSTGRNPGDLNCRAATYVEILRGAKPRDLPVEQPTKFELLVNMNGAGARSYHAAVDPRPVQTRSSSCVLDQRGRLLRAAFGFAGCSMPHTIRRSTRCGHGSTPGPASGTSRSVWRARATTSTSRGTTRRAGARPSTRPGWSTARRAQRVPVESARRGTRRRGRRGRRRPGPAALARQRSRRTASRAAGHGEFTCVPVYLEPQQRLGLTRCEVIPRVTLQDSLRSVLKPFLGFAGPLDHQMSSANLRACQVTTRS